MALRSDGCRCVVKQNALPPQQTLIGERREHLNFPPWEEPVWAKMGSRKILSTQISSGNIEN